MPIDPASSDPQTLQVSIEAPSPANVSEVQLAVESSYDAMIEKHLQRLVKLEDEMLKRLDSWHKQALTSDEDYETQKTTLAERGEEVRASIRKRYKQQERDAETSSGGGATQVPIARRGVGGTGAGGTAVFSTINKLGQIFGLSLGMFGGWEIVKNLKAANDQLRAMRHNVRQLALMSGEMPDVARGLTNVYDALNERKVRYGIAENQTMAEITEMVTKGGMSRQAASELSMEYLSSAMRWGMDSQAGRQSLAATAARWNQYLEVSADRFVDTFDRISATAASLHRPLEEYRKDVETLAMAMRKFGWGLEDANRYMAQYSQDIREGLITPGQIATMATVGSTISEGGAAFLLAGGFGDERLDRYASALREIGGSEMGQAHLIRTLASGRIGAGGNEKIVSELKRRGIDIEREGGGLDVIQRLLGAKIEGMLPEGTTEAEKSGWIAALASAFGINLEIGYEQQMLDVMKGIKSNTEDIKNGAMTEEDKNKMRTYLEENRSISDAFKDAISKLWRDMAAEISITLGTILLEVPFLGIKPENILATMEQTDRYGKYVDVMKQVRDMGFITSGGISGLEQEAIVSGMAFDKGRFVDKYGRNNWNEQIAEQVFVLMAKAEGWDVESGVGTLMSREEQLIRRAKALGVQGADLMGRRELELSMAQPKEERPTNPLEFGAQLYVINGPLIDGGEDFNEVVKKMREYQGLSAGVANVMISGEGH